MARTTPPRQCAPHMITTGSGEFRDSSGTKVEIFSMSLKLANKLGQFYDDAPNKATILTACENFWTAIVGGQLDKGVTLTQVKLAQVNSAGLYFDDPEISQMMVSGGNAAGAGSIPTEIACKVTAQTHSNGKGAGGFYLPAPAVDITDYRFNHTRLQTLANDVGTAFTNLATALEAVPMTAAVTAVLRPAVVPSILESENPTDAELNAAVRFITSINLGDVPDVIRSRRDKFIEVRLDGGFAPGA